MDQNNTDAKPDNPLRGLGAASLLLASLSMFSGLEAVAAPLVLTPGYNVDVFASGLTNLQSLAVDASGNVYVGQGGGLGISKFDGSGTSLGGFATNVYNPMGMAWGSGAFGNHLYIADGVGGISGPARVARVGAGGGPATTFWQTDSPGTETWPFDLGFDNTGTYGNNLFVVDSGGPDSLLQVDSGAARTVLSFVPENLAGLEFSHAGSAFAPGLYTFHQGSALVNHYDPSGNGTTVATVTAGLADGRFGLPGSGFGDLLFLSDNQSDNILTLDPLGNVNTFATGFNFGGPWVSGSMAFSNDGETLYVIDDGNSQVIRIQATSVPSPSSLALLALGLLMLLGVKRKESRTATCR